MIDIDAFDETVQVLKSAKRVAALTGAGISTLCGIPDFRGPKGLYGKPGAERIFDIDCFDRDPGVYYRGCRDLVYDLGRFKPGPVHFALKHLEDAGRLHGIITQNIDMLHTKAGSSNVYEIHGSPSLHRCRRCNGAKTFEEILAMIEAHGGLAVLGDGFIPRCACGGVYKPDIVFFGEPLPEKAFAGAHELAARADLLLVLGTSLTVFPAAGLPRVTLQKGGKIVVVNAQPTMYDDYAFARFNDLAEFSDRILSL